MKSLSPSSSLPLAYYGYAHLGLAIAFLLLVLDPALPGASFYQPRMVALTHLLTLVWLTGSILGSFYIVGPLALRVSMAVGRLDWAAWAAFVLGTAGMVRTFWSNRYDAMAWSAVLVFGAAAFVGLRAVRGLPKSTAPWPVSLHVALAFVNLLSAALLGMLTGLDRSRGMLGVSPLAMMFAHAHLAAIGWAMMMVVGLSYRLIPMIVPAAMPVGASLSFSAILIETGLSLLVVALLRESRVVWVGASLIVAGVAAFVMQIRRTLAHRLPRPPALPLRDWSTWQTHAAFFWLMVAAALGLALGFGLFDDFRLTAMWIYGTAGLVGFLAQIVTGMQGRLVPLYAWYRASAAKGAVPERAANALPSPAFARPIFLLWTAGVPLLAWGLAARIESMVRLGAGLLLAGTATGAVYIAWMLRAARR